MNDNIQEVLNRVLEGYSGYFDICSECPAYPEFCATAQFHSRSEKYVLTQGAKLWAAEAHEYVFFACADVLDIVLWQELCAKAVQYGLTQVKPHNEHMYSYITLVVLANSIDETARQQIKKTKFHKRFKFSFHGWSDLRCAVLDFQSQAVVTNASGKEMRKNLAKYL